MAEVNSTFPATCFHCQGTGKIRGARNLFYVKVVSKIVMVILIGFGIFFVGEYYLGILVMIAGGFILIVTLMLAVLDKILVLAGWRKQICPNCNRLNKEPLHTE